MPSVPNQWLALGGSFDRSASAYGLSIGRSGARSAASTTNVIQAMASQPPIPTRACGATSMVSTRTASSAVPRTPAMYAWATSAPGAVGETDRTAGSASRPGHGESSGGCVVGCARSGLPRGSPARAARRWRFPRRGQVRPGTANPRVEDGVQDVDAGVHEDVADGDDRHHALQRDVLPAEDGVGDLACRCRATRRSPRSPARRR